jgi:hypothetical protein
MERSEEVSEFLSTLIGTFGTDRMSSAFVAALSGDAGTLLLGTDDAEWWGDQESLHRAINAQGPELEGAQATVKHVEGWSEGAVGWGAVRFDVAFAGGPASSLRFTATVVQQGDQWKIVQGHVSIGVPNEEAVGKELTV